LISLRRLISSSHVRSRAAVRTAAGANELKLATAAIIPDRRQQAHACHRRLMPSTPCRLQEAGNSRLLVNWGLPLRFWTSLISLRDDRSATDAPLRQTLRRLKVWGGRLCIHRPPSTRRVNARLRTCDLAVARCRSWTVPRSPGRCYASSTCLSSCPLCVVRW